MTAEAAPPRPDPWATTAPREAMRDLDEGRIVSLAPSVNLTPVGGEMVPVPYNVMDFGGHDDAYTPTVRFTGQRAMVLRSFSQHVHGDEAGTGGGVASGTCGGICEPIGHAAQVRAEGSPVIRHLDRSWMNNRNTVGEAQFVRDTGVYEPPPDTDRIPGSVSTVLSGGAAVAFLDGGGTALAPPPVQAPPAPVLRPPVAPPVPALPAPEPPVVEPPPAAWGLAARLLMRFGPWALVLGAVLIPTNKAVLDDVIPRDEFERGVVKNFYERVKRGDDSWQARDDAMKQIRQHRQQTQTAPAPAPAPGDSGGNVRISEDERRRRCKVGPYDTMKPICSAQGMQTHHIVPDYALRYGNRGEGEDGQKRIPGLPTFGQGMSICVSGNATGAPGNRSQPGDPSREHYWAHAGDAAIAAAGNRNVPIGSLSTSRIVFESVGTTIAAIPQCAPEITKAVAGQWAGRDPKQLGRTTQQLPRGDALQALERGARQDNWQQVIGASR